MRSSVRYNKDVNFTLFFLLFVLKTKMCNSQGVIVNE